MSYLFFNQAADNACGALRDSIKVLLSEMKPAPYWDVYFHLSAALTIWGHITRCLCNLFLLAFNIITAPFLIFTPWHIPSFPIIVATRALTVVVCAATAILQPVLFAMKSLISMICGYQNNSELDFDSTEDNEFENCHVCHLTG